MLQAFTILRMLWMFAALGVVAATAGFLKHYIPVPVEVGISLIPVSLTLCGESLEDSIDLKRQHQGLWCQLAGSIMFVFYIGIAFLLIPINYPHVLDRIFLYSTGCVGLIPLALVMVDCYIGLKHGVRLSRRSSESVNAWTMILIAAAFTWAGIFMAARSPVSDLMPYAVTLFSFVCLAVALNMWWIKKQLHAQIKPPSQTFLTIGDPVAVIVGGGGAALAIRAWTTANSSDRTYEIFIGLLFASLTLLYVVHRVRMLTCRTYTFAATREGIIELHWTGWVLYRWEYFTDAFLCRSAGNLDGISIILCTDPLAQEKSSAPEDSRRAAYEQWHHKRCARQRSYMKYHNADLLLLDPTCRFGIVSMWNGIRLAMENPSQAHKLPSASSLIGELGKSI